MSSMVIAGRRSLTLAALLVIGGCNATPSVDWEPAPVHYTVSFPDPGAHTAQVDTTFFTRGRPTDLFLAAWSPGFYRTQDYAAQVHDLTVRTGDGKAVAVEHPTPNRWHIPAHTGDGAGVSYQLHCENRFVTTNWVGEDFAILNGPATFVAMVGELARPCAVTIELPPGWKQSFSGMPSATPNLYRAADFDMMVDCPIVAGNFSVQEFEVDGHPHRVVNIGQTGPWETARAAADLEKIVAENRRFWGFLPYRGYTFLLSFGPGGGGLEHSSSTLATTSATGMARSQGYQGWLGFISHEYFHTFNVKRLRPVELGPFDYENPPRTASLWVAEGLTNYYGEMLVTRSGLAGPEVFLGHLSSHIHALQTAPGRLVQTLEQASLDVWSASFSGVRGDGSKTVSYYEKGPVVGFLLDAKVRRATGGAKSLDDVMRLAYQRYSGARGFTPDQFRKTAEEVAGIRLAGFFDDALRTTQELDYPEALDWFGLRFEPLSESDKGPSWRLQVREDATAEQREHLGAWLKGVPE